MRISSWRLPAGSPDRDAGRGLGRQADATAPGAAVLGQIAHQLVHGRKIDAVDQRTALPVLAHQAGMGELGEMK
jgi:hypothetical protein